MTPEKSVTNQLSEHNGLFTLDDLCHAIENLRLAHPRERTLRVTPLEYIQIRGLAGIQRVIEINEDEQTLFGMRIEVAPLL